MVEAIPERKKNGEKRRNKKIRIGMLHAEEKFVMQT
jgi:hypothetical protein